MQELKEKLKQAFGRGVSSHLANYANVSYYEAYRWINMDTDRPDIAEAALRMLEEKKQQEVEFKKRLTNV